MHEDDWDNVVARHSDLAIATTWTTKKMKMGKHKLLHDRFKQNKKAIILTVSSSSLNCLVNQLIELISL